MILAALLLLAAAAVPPQTAEGAERAFAAMAQRDGQWTAFRAFAADDAIMFAPGVVNAQAFLNGRKDPPPILMWWPAVAIASCDGSLAISSGPWTRRIEAQGTFTTVWRRQPDGGYKWLLDQGRDTPRRVSAGEKAQRSDASCRNLAAAKARTPAAPAAGPEQLSHLVVDAAPDLIVQQEERMPAAAPAADIALQLGDRIAGGASDDGTLVWNVIAITGQKDGAHLLTVHRWDGRGFRLALIETAGLTTS